MEDIRKIPSRMTFWFVVYFIGVTLVSQAFSALAFGKDVFISFTIILLIVSPAQYLLIYILLHRLNKELSAVIERLLAGKPAESDERFIAGYSVKAMLYMVFVNLLAYIVMVIVSKIRGAILSGAQSAFLFTLALSMTAVAVGLFFYRARIMLYYLGNKINYKPLNMLQKLAIPILSAIMILLSLASVGIYRMTERQVSVMRNAFIESSVGRNMLYLQDYFNSTLSELKAHAQNETIRAMNLNRSEVFLKELHGTRDESKIEMYFVADAQGNVVTSAGQRVQVSEREYFKNIMSGSRYTVSDPVISKASGKAVVVLAVPAMNGDRINGAMCATMPVDTLDKVFENDSKSSLGQLALLDKKGRCIYHNDRNLIGKIIHEEYPDDGKKYKNVRNLFESKEKIFFSYRFNGVENYAYKMKVPVLDDFLVFYMDKADFLKEVNFVVIEIIVSLIVLSLITYVIIHRLAMNFSNPISNMTRIIIRLADGDLTVENKDFLADEFGEMIRNFKIFQGRLKDIIQRAMDAATQLSSSSEELAATSSSLSEGAQSQAASVEEASASIEEISGAVELINNSAGDQAELAKATFSSMEELKKDNETVVGYAKAALDAAQKTTDQANTGQHLMENTITGMNSIDESTKKIADIVRLISDISDQVNLLALNASIEAARAGEHGKGFAVVAEEISKLADETASSAKNITQFVKAGLQEVNKGREYVDATGAALKNIIGFIAQTEDLVRKITESAENQAESSQVVLGDTRKVMEMAESISSSTNEQMLTNQEMSKTVEQINQNTQAAAAAAEQIASSAEEISAQAESLRSQMEFFKV